MMIRGQAVLMRYLTILANIISIKDHTYIIRHINTKQTETMYAVI